MLCDICNINEATIHVQEIYNGKKRTLNICAHCASEHNLTDKDIEGFNLAEVLYNISSQMLNKHSEDDDQKEPLLQNPDFAADKMSHLVCACGWDASNFRKTGRLGCPECYNVFSPILNDALKTMHKGTFHTGKHPGEVSQTHGQAALRIINLQKELEECVIKEEYEKAAKLRDKINQLKADAVKDSGSVKKAKKKNR